MYIPDEPEGRPRRRVPLRDYLVSLASHPARTLSDIALDRPWLRGGGILLAVLVLAGAALGATGLPGAERGLSGVVRGSIFVPIVGAMAFAVVSLALHRMAKSLEGWASYLEMVSALFFAFLPLALLAPAALLRLLPDAWGKPLFFLACVGIAGWTTRLVYLGVRESHRFTGTQAILTMTVPVTIAALVGFMGVIVTALVITIVG